ncbi:DNA/RNA non-specific endonuclease [Massilia psychrophila]|uniref:Uncharacterized protein n=1 Tax=Massilia psychrophila TaxID=1603353 RepID=A0A2G8T4B2_9BURK|nr:DNA/RNA non-specific endonuclease [Massilia psychrophila]PIL40871.1 hypothetical protein CR103_05330 [Massilia psychrophila]GGE72669.1 hypothetical protein GCM10008020_16660 [Massilia psychrophila]
MPTIRYAPTFTNARHVNNAVGLPLTYNSSQPAQLNAHAYAQGTDIHIAPGQEQHLPHEVWHVVQQAQGRVRPTVQMAGVAINDEGGLEREADAMGRRAATGAAIRQQIDGMDLVGPSLPAGHVTQAYRITYGPLHNGSGTDMHVYIDGKNDADLGKGSAPSVTPHWWPAAGTSNRSYLSQYAVQGHLLNNLLGGPGNDMKNMTPITKSTNSTHFKKVEDDVKKEVAADNGVEYRVRANYSSNPPLSDFGTTAPASLNAILPMFAGEIAVDYDVYDRSSLKLLRGLSGELLIKNEGKHKQGTF